MVQFKWIESPNELSLKIGRWGEARKMRVEEDFQALAPDVEDWMRENAPWQDRTGEARATLNVTVERTNNRIDLIMAHGVPYGIYLERMQAGNFSIIGPALAYWGSTIMTRLRQ